MTNDKDCQTERYLTTDLADETDFFNYEFDEPLARRSQLDELGEPRVMVFEKQITIIKIILSTNFDDLIIEISDIIILIIQISFRKNQSVVLLLPKVNLLMSD